MSDGKIEYEVRADTSKIDQDLSGITEKADGHSSKWQGLLDGIGMGIGQNITAKALEAAKAVWELGTGFENGLAKISTLVDTSSTDMDALGASLLELSSSYGVSVTELEQSAYNAISANNALGSDTDGLMQVLEASVQLAAAGFTDVDTAVSTTLKTMNAYGLGVGDVDEIQKILIQTQNAGITTVGELGASLANVTPTAAAMGVSFDQVGAALATMTAAGTATAQSTTQLNSLFAELGKSGTTASESLAAATETTQYAGMSFTDMMAAGVPLNEVLDMMRSYADSNNVSMLDMFSSIEAGKAALSLTGEGATTFASNLDSMSTEADVVGESFNKVSGTSSVSLSKAFNQIKNVAVQLFTALSPIITVILDLVGTIISAISDALGPFLEAFSPIISVVKLLAQVISSAFGGVISTVLNTFANLVTNQFEAIKGVFQGVVDFISGVFTGDWSLAWEGVKKIFSSIISGIAGIFKAPINAIISGINVFIRGINKIKIPDWVPLVGGKGFHISEIKQLRVGLDYVPEDDFPATLHRGEAVLTAAEAKVWRDGGGKGNEVQIDYDRLASAMSGLSVVMDGEAVGRLVEGSVSSQQARRMEAIERSGWNGNV